MFSPWRRSIERALISGQEKGGHGAQAENHSGSDRRRRPPGLHGLEQRPAAALVLGASGGADVHAVLAAARFELNRQASGSGGNVEGVAGETVASADRDRPGVIDSSSGVILGTDRL